MTAFNTSREIPASVDAVYAAFIDPERLARWWGPAGFTNTFHVCEFETGGRWVYTMHSPNGGNPQNESVFELVEPPRKVVIRHISQPLYRLTIDLIRTAASATIVSWSQEFDDAEAAKRIAKIVVPANEQNLDRLTTEVLAVNADIDKGEIGGASPFFIVRNVPATLEFYRNKLGFEITFEGPEKDDIFFGIVQRGRAMIMFKDIGVEPLPNHERDVEKGDARWDVYIYVPDPDTLAEEFASRDVEFFEPLKNNHDNLRGFEIKDIDGYVLFFGRPI